MSWNKKVINKMLGVECFKVELDAPGVYSPGDVIRGNVVIVNRSRIDFSEIYVNFKGCAKVNWFEFSRAARRSDQEIYFDRSVYLLQNRGGCVVHQSPGEHRFPFQFTLPPRIPSSYKDRVRYRIKAVMNRPAGKMNCVAKIPFVVHTVSNLNDDVTLSSPLRVDKICPENKKVRSPYIKMEAWIDKVGYVPGETVYFNAKITNRREKSIRKSCVQLIKYTTYSAGKNRKRTKEKVIFQAVKGKINKNDEFLWDAFPIAIPAVPPSGLDYCKIIDVSYVMALSVDIGFAHPKPSVPLRIVIGNVPLRKQSSGLMTPVQFIRKQVQQLSLPKKKKNEITAPISK